MTEKEWVESIVERLQPALQVLAFDGRSVRAESGKRLASANEIFGYRGDESRVRSAAYQTDILISDVTTDGVWVPRVVIEAKIGSVTTHDALTYSTKASTHKHVHPYLRYGIIIGAMGGPLPGRLIRHGAYFDFMAVHESEHPTEPEWYELMDVIKAEVMASRDLQGALDRTTPRSKRWRLFHRRLFTQGF